MGNMALTGDTLNEIVRSLIGEPASAELQQRVAESLPGKTLQFLPEGTLLTHGMVYDMIFAFVDQDRIVDVRCDLGRKEGKERNRAYDVPNKATD